MLLKEYIVSVLSESFSFGRVKEIVDELNRVAEEYYSDDKNYDLCHDIISAAERLGLTKIGAGAYRKVYSSEGEDWVLKVAYGFSSDEFAGAKIDNAEDFNSWIHMSEKSEYHVPPEIFISEGTPGSIVDDWINEKGGIAAIHHIAYQVDDVAAKMKEWQEKGFAEFTTSEPIVANGLVQCFTKEHPLTGTVYEFISRTTKGFNIDNVRDLMESTNKK